MKLKGRTILITGGSAGIGLAFALEFLELGNEVLVTGRRQAVLDKVKAKHPKLHTVQSDVADPAQIAAFAPDKGESVGSLIKDPLPGAPVPPILPPQDGFLFLDKAKFPASFAADVDPEK